MNMCLCNIIHEYYGAHHTQHIAYTHNTLQWMFYDAKKFNRDLSKWDVSKVDNFWVSTLYIKYWSLLCLCVSNHVTHSTTSICIQEAFCYASSFTSDLSGWDTSSAIWMEVGIICFTTWPCIFAFKLHSDSPIRCNTFRGSFMMLHPSIQIFPAGTQVK